MENFSKKIKSEYIPIITLILGTILIIVGLLLPINIFVESTKVPPLGWIIIFSLHVLGGAGILYSIKIKEPILGLLNLLLMLSAPILILIGTILNRY